MVHKLGKYGTVVGHGLAPLIGPQSRQLAGNGRVRLGGPIDAISEFFGETMAFSPMFKQFSMQILC